jgi:exopolysaccharide biosynthesis protein
MVLRNNTKEVVFFMKRFQKIFISFFLIFTLFSSQIFAFADWNTRVYEAKDEEYIAKGVKHERRLYFTNGGWIHVNLLRVDLNEPSNMIEVLTHTNGLGNKATLSQLVNQNPQVVGAVNGDFFDMFNPATLGPIVKDGELMTTPFYLPHQMATFNLTKDRIPSIEYWTTPEITLSNKNRPAVLQFSTINKFSENSEAAVLYTPQWGEKTPALSKKLPEATEVVIENNHITAFRPAGQGCPIPKNGFVLWTTGFFANHIKTYFAVGEEVELTIKVTPDFHQLASTIGGGAKIVENGQAKTSFTHEIKGIHPRTAIGISKDRKEVFLVTIDGRTAFYSGVSQRELADIMVSLGAFEAINLDGGGSTEMVLRPQGTAETSIVNHPSGGAERRLMDGIGIRNTAQKTNQIQRIKLETKDSNIFVHTSRAITVQGYDENYYPMNVDLNEVHWHVSGIEGSFEDNIFHPTTAGRGTITAEYRGIEASLEVHILEHPVSLTLSPSSVSMEPNSEKWISGIATDREGYQGLVHFRDLHPIIPEGLGTLGAGGVFKASSYPNSGTIQVSLGNATSTLPVSIGGKPLPEKIPDTPANLPDPRNQEAVLQDPKSFQFFAYGKVNHIDTLCDNLVLRKMVDTINATHSPSVFTEWVDSRLTNQLEKPTLIAGQGYNATRHQDSLFVQLDNSRGGLRETDFTQWSWLLQTLKNTDCSSIFILLPQSLSFKDPLEEKLFKDTLIQAKKEKSADVWVLMGGGDTFRVTPENGIRYVQLKDYPQYDSIDIFTELPYMLFTVNGNKVTYEILPMYTK